MGLAPERDLSCVVRTFDGRRANVRTTNGAPFWVFLGGVFDRLFWSSNFFRLAGPEGDDAADGIVRRHADGHAISRDNLDSEAAHPAAQLGEHFMPGVALHSVQSAAVHCDHGSLHVNQIVLAQTASSPFYSTNHCIRGPGPRSRPSPPAPHSRRPPAAAAGRTPPGPGPV